MSHFVLFFINNINIYKAKTESFENNLYLVYKVDELENKNGLNRSEFSLCV